ncbi:histidine kinase dimerization/phospho-acceptor domain-containing protein [Cetobacterium ceti]
MKKFQFKIFHKLFFYSIGIVFLTIVSTYIFNILFLDKFYIYRVKCQVPTIMKNIKNYSNENNITGLNNYTKKLREREGILTLFLNPHTKQWDTYFGCFFPTVSNKEKVLINKQFALRNQVATGAKILIYNEKVGDRWVSIRTSLSTISAYKREIMFFNTIVSFFLVFILTIIGLFISRYFSKDIKAINSAAKSISNLDFIDNINIKRNDEIGDLAKSVEKMSKELKDSITNIESFVSNASHELKTPVAIIMSNTSHLLENNIPNDEVKRIAKIILNETNEMKELISNLLVLSKTNSLHFKLNRKNFILNELIESSLEKYDFLEFSKDLNIENFLNKNIEISGDKNLFGIAIDNIILNAFKYSKEDSDIIISFEENTLHIKNIVTNPNINISHLWDPFVRGKNSSNIEGTGLGMSIIKNILELHSLKYGVLLEKNIFNFWIKF